MYSIKYPLAWDYVLLCLWGEALKHPFFYKKMIVDNYNFFLTWQNKKLSNSMSDSNFFLISRSVQSLSHVQQFVTPWTAAHQTSLSITNSWSLLKLMSMDMESVMPSNHLILRHPLLLPPSIFPASGSDASQIFASGSQSTGVSASASVLPMNIQDWFPLGWTG